MSDDADSMIARLRAQEAAEALAQNTQTASRGSAVDIALVEIERLLKDAAQELRRRQIPSIQRTRPVKRFLRPERDEPVGPPLWSLRSRLSAVPPLNLTDEEQPRLMGVELPTPEPTAIYGMVLMAGGGVRPYEFGDPKDCDWSGVPHLAWQEMPTRDTAETCWYPLADWLTEAVASKCLDVGP